MPLVGVIEWIVLLEPLTMVLYKRTFSDKSRTPSLQAMPMQLGAVSTAFSAYSSWYMRPSWDKVVQE